MTLRVRPRLFTKRQYTFFHVEMNTEINLKFAKSGTYNVMLACMGLLKLLSNLAIQGVFSACRCSNNTYLILISMSVFYKM